MEKKNGLSDVMSSVLEKIHEMVDTNTIVGQPITTPDGITLIPISRVSIGFGTGGGEYGSAQSFAGGGGAGAKVDPVSFIIVKDGSVRIMPVAIPAMGTIDRVLEMVPTLVEKVENIVDKKKEQELY